MPRKKFQSCGNVSLQSCPWQRRFSCLRWRLQNVSNRSCFFRRERSQFYSTLRRRRVVVVVYVDDEDDAAAAEERSCFSSDRCRLVGLWKPLHERNNCGGKLSTSFPLSLSLYHTFPNLSYHVPHPLPTTSPSLSHSLLTFTFSHIISSLYSFIPSIPLYLSLLFYHHFPSFFQDLLFSDLLSEFSHLNFSLLTFLFLNTLSLSLPQAFLLFTLTDFTHVWKALSPSLSLSLSLYGPPCTWSCLLEERS